MAGKRNKKSSFDNPLSGSWQAGRKENVREEKNVRESLPLLTLNFKDFDHSQCPPGQTYKDWEKNGRLAVLMEKFEQVCQMTRPEAVAQQVLKIYDDFPKNSHFQKPRHIQGDVEWGTMQKIGGQKPRLAGYIIGSTFYPVFLDENHLFYPSEKKNT